MYCFIFIVQFILNFFYAASTKDFSAHTNTIPHINTTYSAYYSDSNSHLESQLHIDKNHENVWNISDNSQNDSKLSSTYLSADFKNSSNIKTASFGNLIGSSGCSPEDNDFNSLPISLSNDKLNTVLPKNFLTHKNSNVCDTDSLKSGESNFCGYFIENGTSHDKQEGSLYFDTHSNETEEENFKTDSPCHQKISKPVIKSLFDVSMHVISSNTEFERSSPFPFSTTHASSLGDLLPPNSPPSLIYLAAKALSLKSKRFEEKYKTLRRKSKIKAQKKLSETSRWRLMVSICFLQIF